MPRWTRKLARDVYTRDGRRLRTLADARATMIRLKRDRALRGYWQHAAKLVLEAADGGDVKPATDQLIIALLHDGALDVSRTVQSTGR